jgi:flagellar motor protein MotB
LVSFIVSSLYYEEVIMKRKTAVAFVGMWLSLGSAYGDVSEMIFYPQADFSEGIFHFNYQGEKHKNYGFMFEKGFDINRIVYVRPENHHVEKTKEGLTKLSFANTDRYSYLQYALKDDFLVSESNGVYKILLSGGDCKGAPECVTAENILTVNVPKGYGVRSYQGLDQDLKPLKNPQWQRKGNTYTLTARDVKGACIMMELERLKPGQSAPKTVMAEAIIPKPLPSAPTPKAPEPIEPIEPAPIEPAPQAPTPPEPIIPPSVEPTAPQPIAQITPPAPKIDLPAPIAVRQEPVAVKPTPTLSKPASYFRNFQLFENRIVAVSEAGKERLREWTELFKAGGYTSVTINSYTDNIPPQRLKAQYPTNVILSEARAKMVAEYLVSLGIPADAIRINGMGEADPVASNDTEEGRSKNRRIEFNLQ